MKSVEQIQSDIESLPHEEYLKLVRWFSEKDWDAWDHQLEDDASSGKLDFLINEALEEKAGNKLQNGLGHRLGQDEAEYNSAISGTPSCTRPP